MWPLLTAVLLCSVFDEIILAAPDSVPAVVSRAAFEDIASRLGFESCLELCPSPHLSFRRLPTG